MGVHSEGGVGGGVPIAPTDEPGQPEVARARGRELGEGRSVQVWAGRLESKGCFKASREAPSGDL